MTGEAYNASARKDLAKTSGSAGKDLKVRSSPAGATTITFSNLTKDGFIVQPISGIVDFDKVSVHYVVDADLNNNIPGTSSNT